MHKKLWLIIGLFLLAGCSDQNWRTNDITEVMPALDFDLVNEEGIEVDETDYAGKTTLVYFGYTNCPDVCPITLAKVASVVRQLDENDRDDVQILFITVDPSRDTSDVLQLYTDAFGPEFVGLTGEKEDIDAVANRYRITYEYGDKDARGNYDVTHSSAVFAFNQDNQARFMIRDSDSREAILADLKQMMSDS